MILDLRDFYKEFKIGFNELVDKMKIIVVDKNTSNSDFKSWSKTKFVDND